MISLISVGIKSYIDKTIQEIACANLDAEKVYTTFKYVLGREFSDFSSICLINVRSSDFISILSGIASTFSSENTLIIFFSCLAVQNNEEFNLVFSDEDGSGRGQINISHLKNILTKYKGEYVIVLDCCYSESALGIANKLVASSKCNISVIASTPYYLRAKYDLNGSHFTNVFCDALIQIFENENDLTINNIVSAIETLGSPCYVNVAEGKSDLALKKFSKITDYTNFSRNFFSKLNCNNRVVREMMWYSLQDIPSKKSLEIIDNFIFNSVKTCEADWLVRRAIGSLLSTLKGNSHHIYETELNLLNSNNWMLQTIGLIACRHNVNIDISNILRNMVINKENPMSLVWLADLYLSDSKFADLEVSLKSNLAKTGWGLIQIWDRHCNRYNTFTHFFDFILNLMS